MCITSVDKTCVGSWCKMMHPPLLYLDVAILWHIKLPHLPAVSSRWLVALRLWRNGAGKGTHTHAFLRLSGGHSPNLGSRSCTEHLNYASRSAEFTTHTNLRCSVSLAWCHWYGHKDNPVQWVFCTLTLCSTSCKHGIILQWFDNTLWFFSSQPPLSKSVWTKQSPSVLHVSSHLV